MRDLKYTEEGWQYSWAANGIRPGTTLKDHQLSPRHRRYIDRRRSGFEAKAKLDAELAAKREAELTAKRDAEEAG